MIKDWKNEVASILRNLMPYAFVVDGKRVPLDKESFDYAVGHVNCYIDSLMKDAFIDGYAAATPKQEGEDSLDYRAKISFICDGKYGK